MEAGWKSVHSHLPEMLEIMQSYKLCDHLIAKGLITIEEYERLTKDSMDDTSRSRLLLVSILPKKKAGSFHKFLKVLKETEQEHVADMIIKEEEQRTLGWEGGREGGREGGTGISRFLLLEKAVLERELKEVRVERASVKRKWEQEGKDEIELRIELVCVEKTTVGFAIN